MSKVLKIVPAEA